MKHSVLSMAVLLAVAAGQAAVAPAFAQSDGGWIVSETTSPVDYSPQISATVPGNGASSLSVYCRRGRTEVALSIDEFARYAVGTQVTGSVTVDGGEAVRHAWTQQPGAGLGEAVVLMLRADAVGFLRSLPSNGRMAVRVADSAGVPHNAEFTLAGLNAVRDRVASACRWPSR